MIVIRLTGGLGNQMFQYATARALALRLREELVIDVRDYKPGTNRPYGLKYWRIPDREANAGDLAPYPKWLRALIMRLHKYVRLPSRFYIEPAFTYNPDWPRMKGGRHLNGYFQSEKYFRDIRAELLEYYQPNYELGEENQRIAALAQATPSIMLHVRRGDYLQLATSEVCSLDYYRSAISLMRERVADARFFVFSDDLAWARENLPLGDDAIFVDGNAATPATDIYLMAQCKYHIIANSSFSWWGAWLARTESPFVVWPKPWFSDPKFSAADLIPAHWHALKR